MPAVLLFALVLAAPAAPGRIDRRPPVDQCAGDPSFAAFREALRGAVARRDVAFIMATVSDDVVVDFSGAAGRDDFFRIWGLSEPRPSRLWPELRAVLDLGCARGEDGAFWAPSLFVQLGDQEDSSSALLAIRPGATLHAAPDPAAAVLARLEWDVLTPRPGEEVRGWRPVALADGRGGYVRSADVRSLLDYRASFVRIGGRWRMTAMIAGD